MQSFSGVCRSSLLYIPSCRLKATNIPSLHPLTQQQLSPSVRVAPYSSAWGDTHGQPLMPSSGTPSSSDRVCHGPGAHQRNLGILPPSTRTASMSPHSVLTFTLKTYFIFVSEGRAACVWRPEGNEQDSILLQPCRRPRDQAHIIRLADNYPLCHLTGLKLHF